MVNSINLDPRNNRAGFLKAVYLMNRKVIIFCNLMLLIVTTKTTSNTGSKGRTLAYLSYHI